jgi:hypothetical protein
MGKGTAAKRRLDGRLGVASRGRARLLALVAGSAFLALAGNAAHAQAPGPVADALSPPSWLASYTGGAPMVPGAPDLRRGPGLPPLPGISSPGDGALGVLSRDVVNAADGWAVAEAAVWPLAVVVADE